MVAAERLSRLVSKALRHEPWLYELELDPQGWVPVEALLEAVRREGPEWAEVDRTDLEGMIGSAAKQRHELVGDRIRALYGHSVPGRIELVAGVPPARLFHGTSPEAERLIREVGLRPMGRQYVHLSADVDIAQEVGRRKSRTPVLLTVDTAAARAAGTRFWRGNDKVWLADEVRPEHLGAG